MSRTAYESLALQAANIVMEQYIRQNAILFTLEPSSPQAESIYRQMIQYGQRTFNAARKIQHEAV